MDYKEPIVLFLLNVNTRWYLLIVNKQALLQK